MLSSFQNSESPSREEVDENKTWQPLGPLLKVKKHGGLSVKSHYQLKGAVWE